MLKKQLEKLGVNVTAKILAWVGRRWTRRLTDERGMCCHDLDGVTRILRSVAHRENGGRSKD